VIFFILAVSKVFIYSIFAFMVTKLCGFASGSAFKIGFSRELIGQALGWGYTFLGISIVESVGLAPVLVGLFVLWFFEWFFIFKIFLHKNPSQLKPILLCSLIGVALSVLVNIPAFYIFGKNFSVC
jgi:hypothetical protein